MCVQVILLSFKHDGLRWADVELFSVVGRCDTLVNGLVQYVDKFLVPYLIAVETQQAFLIFTLVDGNHDVSQKIVLSVLEDGSPFYVSFTIALEACRACPYPRLARQCVRLVILVNHNLSQFENLVF